MTQERCPTCRGPMQFHAITVHRGEWRRWIECPKCAEATNTPSYISMTVDGDLDVISSTMPPKNMLARNEVYDDE